MLFETEEKALRFIKFNADDIKETGNGIVPTRAYYCQVCGGWHVTHFSDTEKSRELDERVNTIIDKAKKLKPLRKLTRQEMFDKSQDKRKEEALEYTRKHFEDFYPRINLFKEYLKTNPDNLDNLTLQMVYHYLKASKRLVMRFTLDETIEFIKQHKL